MSSITSVLALPFSLLGISCQDLGQVSCLQEGVYLVDLKQAKCQSFLQQRWISRELWRGAKLATLGLPWWLRWQRIRLQYRRPGFNPWVGKIPWRRGWLPTPVSLSGEFHGQRSLVGYSPRGLKELDMSERLSKTTCLSVLGIISSSKQSRPQKLRNFDLPTNCLKEFAQRCLFLE